MFRPCAPGIGTFFHEGFRNVSLPQNVTDTGSIETCSDDPEDIRHIVNRVTCHAPGGGLG